MAIAALCFLANSFYVDHLMWEIVVVLQAKSKSMKSGGASDAAPSEDREDKSEGGE